MQEPGPAGSESVSDSETRQVTNAREKVDQHCREAVDFMRQGDYDRAAECYLQAIELDPEYLPAHNNLAIVYEKKPAWHQKAVQQWERVLELSTSEGDQKHERYLEPPQAVLAFPEWLDLVSQVCALREGPVL